MIATAPVQSSSGLPALEPVQQTLFGRFMLPDQSEHPCQVHGITIDGAIFVTEQVPPPGLSIVAYLEEVGRVEATTSDPVEGGLRVTFALTGARRDRFESRLRWLVEKQKGGSEEDRRHVRYEPTQKTSQITMPDGREYNCEVMDISLSGAAIKVEVMPSLGTYIMLGKMRGRVVRYLDNGIAIEFVKLLDRSQLSEHVR